MNHQSLGHSEAHFKLVLINHNRQIPQKCVLQSRDVSMAMENATEFVLLLFRLVKFDVADALLCDKSRRFDVALCNFFSVYFVPPH